MKRFGIKLFNIFISLISTSKAKKLLWSSLDSVMRKTYPRVNGGTGYEEHCWEQIAQNFNKERSTNR